MTFVAWLFFVQGVATLTLGCVQWVVWRLGRSVDVRALAQVTCLAFWLVAVSDMTLAALILRGM